MQRPSALPLVACGSSMCEANRPSLLATIYGFWTASERPFVSVIHV